MISLKKVRGQRRKLNRLLNNIESIVPYQSTDFSYEHFHVPGGRWIESAKTSGKNKSTFIKKWLEKTVQIYNSKPKELPFCKVVALVNEPYFWNSQIIIFYDKEYYENFFDRNSGCQIWTPMSNGISLLRQRNINCTLAEKGYTETIYDEDSAITSNLWFYGDV